VGDRTDGSGLPGRCLILEQQAEVGLGDKGLFASERS